MVVPAEQDVRMASFFKPSWINLKACFLQALEAAQDVLKGFGHREYPKRNSWRFPCVSIKKKSVLSTKMPPVLDTER